jgi:GNAT superfamily N-acetyltransferase
MTHAADSTLSIRVEFAGVTADDLEELVALRIAAMRPSLEHLGRFDPKRARERLLESFHPEHTEVVSLDGQRVGFYTLRPAEDGLHLDHLYIHPSCQSLGVGSHVMHRVAARAGARHLPVYLGALRDSPSNRFYQRHGFVQIRRTSGTSYVRHPDTHEAMQRIRSAEPRKRHFSASLRSARRRTGATRPSSAGVSR